MWQKSPHGRAINKQADNFMQKAFSFSAVFFSSVYRFSAICVSKNKTKEGNNFEDYVFLTNICHQKKGCIKGLSSQVGTKVPTVKH